MQNIIGVIVLAVFGFFMGMAIAIVLSLLGACILQFFVNDVVEGYAGIPHIGFWQAYGLIFVCNILFKNSSTSVTAS